MQVRAGAGLWWRWAGSLVVAAFAFMAMVALLGWLKAPAPPRAEAALPPLADLALRFSVRERGAASPTGPLAAVLP